METGCKGRLAAHSQPALFFHRLSTICFLKPQGPAGRSEQNVVRRRSGGRTPIIPCIICTQSTSDCCTACRLLARHNFFVISFCARACSELRASWRSTRAPPDRVAASGTCSQASAANPHPTSYEAVDDLLNSVLVASFFRLFDLATVNPGAHGSDCDASQPIAAASAAVVSLDACSLCRHLRWYVHGLAQFLRSCSICKFSVSRARGARRFNPWHYLRTRSSGETDLVTPCSLLQSSSLCSLNHVSECGSSCCCPFLCSSCVH